VVYEQTPAAETLARQGENVVLVYNPGFVPVTIPNLVGLSVQEATNVLKQAGLRLVVNNFIASPDIPANQILVQTPTAGLGARPNAVVTVDVSGGTNTVRIPDVLGDEQTAATKLLSAAPLNLLVTVVLETNEAIEAGRVVRSEPLGDTAVAPGSAITLYVSSGKATVTVPSVIGQTAAAASTQLTALGLTVTLVEQDVAAEDPSVGTVITQNVAAGTNVQPGSALTLTVARAAVTP